MVAPKNICFLGQHKGKDDVNSGRGGVTLLHLVGTSENKRCF